MSDWSALDQELAEWSARELRLPLWWRDDDAVEMTTELERLGALAEGFGLVLHLAVLPSLIKPSLGENLGEDVRCLVHGWAHKNHALEGKKCEFGVDRPLALRTGELSEGLERVQAAFGMRARACFVPPWNRLGHDLVGELPRLGFVALSTYAPRKAREAAEGLEQVNTHIDPIDWRGTRGAVCADQLSAKVAGLLRDRREGQTDTQEPLGLLTHHLVHDSAIWSVTERLLERLMGGPAYATVPFDGSNDCTKL